MSRTDVHAPYRIKVKDPGWRALFAEDHDHSQGECDLEKFLVAREWIRTQCTIKFLWNGRNIHCGCNLCVDRIGRKLKRRLERRTAKQALRSGDWEEAMSTGTEEPYWFYRGPTTWRAFQVQKDKEAWQQDQSQMMS